MHLPLVCCRHQLLPDDDLGPLYDLLIDEPAEIRHAIGALVYDHLIAQKFNSSQSSTKGFIIICALFHQLNTWLCAHLYNNVAQNNVLSRWRKRFIWGPSRQNVADIKRILHGSDSEHLCDWWCLGVHEGHEGINFRIVVDRRSDHWKGELSFEPWTWNCLWIKFSTWVEVG